jgi:hypothetical protein
MCMAHRPRRAELRHYSDILARGMQKHCDRALLAARHPAVTTPLPAAMVRMAQALKAPYDDLNGKAFLIVPG